mgnify:CR=1 FL=1
MRKLVIVNGPNNNFYGIRKQRAVTEISYTLI